MDDIKALIEAGQLPPDFLKRHEEAKRQNVFGFDHKTDANGDPIEQGIGSAANQTRNQINAYKKYAKYEADFRKSCMTRLSRAWRPNWPLARRHVLEGKGAGPALTMTNKRGDEMPERMVSHSKYFAADMAACDLQVALLRIARGEVDPVRIAEIALGSLPVQRWREMIKEDTRSRTAEYGSIWLVQRGVASGRSSLCRKLGRDPMT